MRLVISENENGRIILYNINRNGTREYCKDYDALYTIVKYLMNNEFEIVMCDKDVKLKGNNFSILIKNYRRVTSHPELKDLDDLVYNVAQRKGFTRVDPKKKLSHAHSHKSKSSNGKVFIGTIAAIIGIILIIAITVDGRDKTTDVPIIIDTPAQVQQIENYLDEEDDYNFVYSEDTTSEDEQATEEVQEDEPDAYFEFEHLCDTDKAINCKNLYYDLICKYSHLYGIDPDMMLALATQERGVHSREIDGGGGVGLMQLQYSVWCGQIIDGYKLNEETGKFEYVSYKVTDDNIRNLETNIEFGCMVMQQCLKITGYNVPMSLQMYNMGYGSIHEGLVEYCADTNQDRTTVCLTPTDIGWLEYCRKYAGDPDYISHVIRWAENPEFSNFDVDDLEYVSFKFGNALDRGR